MRGCQFKGMSDRDDVVELMCSFIDMFIFCKVFRNVMTCVKRRGYACILLSAWNFP